MPFASRDAFVALAAASSAQLLLASLESSPATWAVRLPSNGSSLRARPAIYGSLSEVGSQGITCHIGEARESWSLSVTWHGWFRRDLPFFLLSDQHLEVHHELSRCKRHAIPRPRSREVAPPEPVHANADLLLQSLHLGRLARQLLKLSIRLGLRLPARVRVPHFIVVEGVDIPFARLLSSLLAG